MTDGQGWQRVAALGDLAPDQPLGARLGDLDIVLVAHDGQVFALDGICPHAYALMSEGFMNGPEIECPLHAACFDIRTGKLVDGPPGTRDLTTFEVRVTDGVVMVRATS